MKLTHSLALLGLLVLTGCSTVDRSQNTTRAQFLDQVWVSPELRGKAPADVFTSVYFAPVGTTELKKQDWWKAQNARTQEQIQADARKLAGYMHESLIKAARNHPNARMKVVSQPGPGTLVIESAITELVPAKVFWNSAATAAGFVLPGAGLLSAAGQGAITIEGRLRDGANGNIIGLFRDRQTDQIALANLANYTWYHGSEANIDELAKKTAEILNAPAGTVVKRSVPFKLVAF